jgi:hypothetical protein
MNYSPPSKRKRYLTARQVRERYGGRSEMWLWRRERRDPEWPRPMVTGRRKFYDERELDDYDAAHRMGGAYASARA